MKDVVNIFKALADPTRLRITLLLLRRELCVCELMFVLNMAQSRVSHQLRILRDAGLVEDTRDGQWIIYHLPDKVRATIAPLLGLFGHERRGAGEGEEDEKRLDACLKEGIRKTKCPPTGIGTRRLDGQAVRKAGKPPRSTSRGEQYGH